MKSIASGILDMGRRPKPNLSVNKPVLQPHPQPDFKAGGTGRAAHKWHLFTSDKWVLDMVKGLTIELAALPTQETIPDSTSPKPGINELLSEQIDIMLRQGIIEPAMHSSRSFVSHMFLRPKTDGSYRPILNLSGLNDFTIYRHFKMDHLSSVMRMVPQNSFMASIDITSAYFSLPVKPRDRDLLQLQFKGKRYRYTCLPNGYSPGPRVFTKIMKALLAHLRVHYGVNLVFYIDDTLIYGNTPQLVQGYVEHTLRVLQEAGFTISYKKSALIPTQVITYLGFQIDSTTLTLTIPPTKAESLQEMLVTTLGLSTITIRKFAGVLGRLAATDPGNDRAKVLIKPLQRAKQTALTASYRDYEAVMTLSKSTKACLSEWLVHLPYAKSVYADLRPQITVYTDSSKVGWGAFWVQGGLEYGEVWPLDIQELHINILELKAILTALKFLNPHVKNRLVHLFIDNTTAIACIRKGGSNASKSCNAVTESIYRLAWKHGITFKLSYCPTKLNVEADRASRAFISSGEWTLSPDTITQVFSVFPKPDIDLFAASNNHVCDKYVTLTYDANACATDAFTLKWDMHSLMFPPFSIVGRAVRKLRQDRTKGILVIPAWITQPWYPTVARLKGFHNRLEIPVTQSTLLWPGKKKKLFPLAGRMKLYVIPV